MPLRASIDLGNEYFRVEHISDAKDVKTALAGFSADPLLRENAWVFEVGGARGEFHIRAYQAEIRSGLRLHVSAHLTFAHGLDGKEDVQLLAAKVEKMIKYSADLSSFAVDATEVGAVVQEDKVTIKATFLKPNNETKGFMKLELTAPTL